jgi:hypothetical protein
VSAVTTEQFPAAALPADPYTALAVHYGMPLGVADFEVLAGNPRGKLQLHQAWQHGKGVNWGYPVRVADEGPVLEVGPGLGVDGLGRDVPSAALLCLDVRAWSERQNGPQFQPRADGSFDARLYLRHKACLARPVPSLGATTSSGGDDAAFSRVLETAQLELRPYTRPPTCDAPDDDRSSAWSALRDLVREGRRPGGATVPAGGWLDAFRDVAARTGAALGPPGFVPEPSERDRRYPEDEPGELLLADLPGLKLTRDTGGWRLEAPVIDLSVRRVLLPTWILQELLAELLAGSGARGPSADAGGPRVIRVIRTGDEVTVELTRDVAQGTVAGALDLRLFDASATTPAWGPPIEVTPAVTGRRTGPQAVPARIRFTLPETPTPDRTYRLVLRGTGPAPLVGLVGRRPVPLAGRIGGPAAPATGGADVVEILDEGENR